MGWLTQPYYDKGREDGRTEGEAEGIAAGEAKILTRLLEKRFGDVPGSVREWISFADAETIETWLGPAFEAERSAVFELILKSHAKQDRADRLAHKRVVVIQDSVLAKSLGQVDPERMERILANLTQPRYNRGRSIGRAEGKADGEADGAGKVLSRFLAKRFGEVPFTYQEQILGADVESIEGWVERAFKAPDLRSVFFDNTDETSAAQTQPALGECGSGRSTLDSKEDRPGTGKCVSH